MAPLEAAVEYRKWIKTPKTSFSRWRNNKMSSL